MSADQYPQGDFFLVFSVASPLLPKETINQDFTVFVFHWPFILYLL
jgi:hypothetical protein